MDIYIYIYIYIYRVRTTLGWTTKSDWLVITDPATRDSETKCAAFCKKDHFIDWFDLGQKQLQKKVHEDMVDTIMERVATKVAGLETELAEGTPVQVRTRWVPDSVPHSVKTVKSAAQLNTHLRKLTQTLDSGDGIVPGTHFSIELDPSLIYAGDAPLSSLSQRTVSSSNNSEDRSQWEEKMAARDDVQASTPRARAQGITDGCTIVVYPLGGDNVVKVREWTRERVENGNEIHVAKKERKRAEGHLKKLTKDAKRTLHDADSQKQNFDERLVQVLRALTEPEIKMTR